MGLGWESEKVGEEGEKARRRRKRKEKKKGRKGGGGWKGIRSMCMTIGDHVLFLGNGSITLTFH